MWFRKVLPVLLGNYCHYVPNTVGLCLELCPTFASWKKPGIKLVIFWKSHNSRKIPGKQFELSWKIISTLEMLFSVSVCLLLSFDPFYMFFLAMYSFFMFLCILALLVLHDSNCFKGMSFTMTMTSPEQKKIVTHCSTTKTPTSEMYDYRILCKKYLIWDSIYLAF